MGIRKNMTNVAKELVDASEEFMNDLLMECLDLDAILDMDEDSIRKLAGIKRLYSNMHTYVTMQANIIDEQNRKLDAIMAKLEIES